MYTLLKPFLVREELLKRGAKLFTQREFRRIFDARNDQTKYFMEQQVKRDGIFFRLKKGLYGLRTDLPSEEEIANALYKPSYISFEYALAYHGILPEMPYEVTCATTKPTRIFDVNSKTFSYNTIKKSAYTGYDLMSKEGRKFLMADPEKALIDFIYFISIGKKNYNERFMIKNLNKSKALEYAKLFSRPLLVKLVKKYVNN